MSKNAGVLTAVSTSTPEPAMCCTSIEPVAVPVSATEKRFTGSTEAVK